MSTGSHTVQLYWAEGADDRRLELIPFHYKIEEGIWMSRDSHFLAPEGDQFGAGDWNEGCIHCHATRGQPRTAHGAAETRVAEFGIGCESCHGPAANHVSLNRSPQRRYALHFSEALNEELEGKGVSVTALCPGPVMTEFQQVAGMETSGLVLNKRLVSIEEVVEAGYDAMMHGKAYVIPGIGPKLLSFGVRFMPRRFVAKFVRRMQADRAT